MMWIQSFVSHLGGKRPSKTRVRAARNGTAFFMMVLAILIVITLATGALIRGEWANRRNQRDLRQTQTLIAAINAVAGVSADSMTLPVTLERSGSMEEESIQVSLDPSSDQYTARWMRGEREVDVLVRKVNKLNPE